MIFHRDFRPVPLTEQIKVGSSILDKDGKLVRKIKDQNVNASKQTSPNNPQFNELYLLCEEVISNPSHSVLVFAGSKEETKNVSRELAQRVRVNQNYKIEERKLLVQRLQSATNGSA